MSLHAVAEQPEPDEGLLQQQLFEGEVVSRSRLAPGSPGKFACIDLDTQEGLILHKGDIVTVQYDTEIGEILFTGGRTKPSDRVHIGDAIKGSQAVVRVIRKTEDA